MALYQGGNLIASAGGGAPVDQNKTIFYAGTSAPSDTTIFWIDTNASTGGLKYYNGSAWVVVPVAYS